MRDDVKQPEMRFEALQYHKHALHGLRSKKGISENHMTLIRLEAQLTLLREEDGGGEEDSYPGRRDREPEPQGPTPA